MPPRYDCTPSPTIQSPEPQHASITLLHVGAMGNDGGDMPAQERKDNVVAQLEELEALEAIYEGGCEIIGRDANSAASATETDCCPEVCRCPQRPSTEWCPYRQRQQRVLLYSNTQYIFIATKSLLLSVAAGCCMHYFLLVFR